MKIKQVGSNMTKLSLPNGTDVLFSYETPVAAYVPAEGYVRSWQRYSVTTTRHVNKWLNGHDSREVPQSFIDALINRKGE